MVGSEHGKPNKDHDIMKHITKENAGKPTKEMKHLSTYQMFEGMFEESRALKPHEKLLAGAVVSYYKKHADTNNAQIIVKHKPSDKFIGDVKLNDTTVKRNKFIVFFNKDKSIMTGIKSLFHELVHVKQIANGELLPADDYKSILWNGKQHITVPEYNKIMKVAYKDPSKYNELPWEKEAIESSEKLTKDFVGSTEWNALRGKDDNLDFILDNI